MRGAREDRMDDIGETEDIPDTDVGAAAPGGVTTAVTIIQKTVWEQTLLAFQQLGVRERNWGAMQCPPCILLMIHKSFWTVIVYIL